MTIQEILEHAERRYNKLPKWKRNLIEAERRREDEVSECPWCSDSHPRRSRHWEWCAYRG